VAHAALRDFCFTRGEDQISTFTPDGWSRRTFCGTCGSPLPGLNREHGEVGIPAGLLDDDPGVKPTLHIMVASKAPWHELTADVPTHAAFPDDW
jgi:hypothetical protein